MPTRRGLRAAALRRRIRRGTSTPTIVDRDASLVRVLGAYPHLRPLLKGLLRDIGGTSSLPVAPQVLEKLKLLVASGEPLPRWFDPDAESERQLKRWLRERAVQDGSSSIGTEDSDRCLLCTHDLYLSPRMSYCSHCAYVLKYNGMFSHKPRLTALRLMFFKRYPTAVKLSVGGRAAVFLLQFVQAGELSHAWLDLQDPRRMEVRQLRTQLLHLGILADDERWRRTTITCVIRLTIDDVVDLIDPADRALILQFFLWIHLPKLEKFKKFDPTVLALRRQLRMCLNFCQFLRINNVILKTSSAKHFDKFRAGHVTASNIRPFLVWLQRSDVISYSIPVVNGTSTFSPLTRERHDRAVKLLRTTTSISLRNRVMVALSLMGVMITQSQRLRRRDVVLGGNLAIRLGNAQYPVCAFTTELLTRYLRELDARFIDMGFAEEYWLFPGGQDGLGAEPVHRDAFHRALKEFDLTASACRNSFILATSLSSDYPELVAKQLNLHRQTGQAWAKAVGKDYICEVATRVENANSRMTRRSSRAR